MIFESRNKGAVITFGNAASGFPMGRVFSQARQLPQMQLNGPNGKIRGAAFSPGSGHFMAIYPKRAHLWRVPVDLEDSRWKHSGEEPCFAFASRDRIWAPLWNTEVSRASGLEDVSGQTLVSINTRKADPQPAFAGHLRFAIEASRDGNSAVAGARAWHKNKSYFLRFFRHLDRDEFESSDVAIAFPPGKSRSPLDFSEDGRHALAASIDGLITIFDVASAKQASQFETGLKNGLIAAAFCNQDRSIVAVHAIKESLQNLEFRLHLWDLEGNDLHQETFYFRVREIDVSPNGRWLALACADKRIRVLDLSNLGKNTGAGQDSRFAHSFRAHDEEVLCVQYDDTGTVLASGSEDQRLKLWNAGNGYTAGRMWLANGAVQRVHFSPNGEKVACITDSLEILSWKVVEETPSALKAFDIARKSYLTTMWTNADLEDQVRTQVAGGKEVELLSGLTPPSQWGADSAWSRPGDYIESEPHGRAWIDLPGDFANVLAYRIDLDIQAIDLGESFSVTLPVGRKATSYIINGWPSSEFISGLYRLNGAGMPNGPHAVRGEQFTDNHRHKLAIEVRQSPDFQTAGIVVTFDGNQLMDWSGPVSALDVPRNMKRPAGKIALSTYQKTWRVHSAKVRLLENR